MFLSSRSLESSREDRCNYIKSCAQFLTHSKTSVSTGAYQWLFSIIIVTQWGNLKQKKYPQLSANTMGPASGIMQIQYSILSLDLLKSFPVLSTIICWLFIYAVIRQAGLHLLQQKFSLYICMISDRKLYSVKGFLIFGTEIPVIFLTFTMNKVYPVIQAFGTQRCTTMQMTPGDIPQSNIYLVLYNFCLFHMSCLLPQVPVRFLRSRNLHLMQRLVCTKFIRERARDHTQGRDGKKRKQNWAEGKLGLWNGLTATLSQPSGSFEPGRLLQSCHKLSQCCWAFTYPCRSVIGRGLSQELRAWPWVGWLSSAKVAPYEGWQSKSLIPEEGSEWCITASTTYILFPKRQIQGSSPSDLPVIFMFYHEIANACVK